jgi:hypothetical protein
MDDMKFHDITISRIENKVLLYVDGIKISEKSISSRIINLSQSVMIGQDQDCFNGCIERHQRWKGLIDDFRIYNRALNQAEIEELHNMGKKSIENTSVNLVNGLIGYYKFEGNLKDDSGKGNDGVVKQGNISYKDNGLTGKALSTEVEGVYLPNLFQNETFTITAWCKFNLNHNEIYGRTGITVWHDNTDTVKQSFGFTPSSGNLYVYLKHEYPELIVRNNNPNARGGGSLYYGDNQLTSNQWQLITIIYNNKNINVYIDGKLIIKNKVTNNSAMGRDLRIEARDGDIIDNIRVYNRILNQVEIEELYQKKR